MEFVSDQNVGVIKNVKKSNNPVRVRHAQEGGQLQNPFYSIWATDLYTTNLALDFFILTSIFAGVYFMIVRHHQAGGGRVPISGTGSWVTPWITSAALLSMPVHRQLFKFMILISIISEIVRLETAVTICGLFIIEYIFREVLKLM